MSTNLAWTLATLLGSAAMIFLWRMWQRRVDTWRKRKAPFKSLRHDPRYKWAPAHPPPRPFHVDTKLGDPGDPRMGVSTRNTDKLFENLRRIFGAESKRRR